MRKKNGRWTAKRAVSRLEAFPFLVTHTIQAPATWAARARPTSICVPRPNDAAAAAATGAVEECGTTTPCKDIDYHNNSKACQI